ncbi:hypothetical protein [Ktedonospora formicarum]|uniref:Uncharacterized protein n=1 Tax=Ktedonospora formicarum TaxID=2778364 RepID=A0A8J3IB72_9CHLR|nr:hypothetical protein [Ktedonospora formicarum]GHO50806.1 hypothetical protein KSX_89690 [Ktedonospora formicarum]
MRKQLIRWISPLLILAVIVAAVVIGSVMVTVTHAAGVNAPHHPATEQTTPTPQSPTIHPDHYWFD